MENKKSWEGGFWIPRGKRLKTREMIPWKII